MTLGRGAELTDSFDWETSFSTSPSLEALKATCFPALLSRMPLRAVLFCWVMSSQAVGEGLGLVGERSETYEL